MFLLNSVLVIITNKILGKKAVEKPKIKESTFYGHVP